MCNPLLDHLSGFLTPKRNELFNKILNMRTRHITIVLEDIFQSQNASAVLRTCDCFGIQDVHVVENRNIFQDDSEVSLGSSKWLNLKKYNSAENNSLEAVRQLKKQGYRIVATTPHTNDQELQDFDISKGKTALVFGSELPGITESLLNEADEYLKIPMYGFTESFNISVSAAITLHHLTLKMRETEGLNWQLSQKEKDDLKFDWIRKTIKRSELIEKRFREDNKDS